MCLTLWQQQLSISDVKVIGVKKQNKDFKNTADNGDKILVVVESHIQPFYDTFWATYS